jgi:hypothetical protein
MENTNWETIISYPPDKEEPIAEIYYKNEQCFEINYEDYGFFVVKIFNNEDGNFWEFSYDESIEGLQKAKNRLAEHQRTPEQQKRYDERIKELENWKPTPEETAEYERKMKEQREKYYGDGQNTPSS